MTAVEHELSQVDWGEIAYRRWYFTFGADHSLQIVSAEDEMVLGTGIALAGRYVVLSAQTESEARETFIELFGNHFASQYDEIKGAEIVERYSLEELQL